MKQIMNQEQLSRTLKRMTHEIIERNLDLNNLVLVGILNKGYPVAINLKKNLKRFADIDIPTYKLDIKYYRDDLKNTKLVEKKNNLEIENKDVILVDDVLYTGRSVRAAMDALVAMGRPKTIQLAVLIDRGHRELPIRADYVGKNIPTSKDEQVIVNNDIEVIITIKEKTK